MKKRSEAPPSSKVLRGARGMESKGEAPQLNEDRETD